MSRIIFLSTVIPLLLLSNNIQGEEPEFTPVHVATEVLTMTGKAEDEAETPPRDFVFNPVHVTTETLTMTGMAE